MHDQSDKENHPFYVQENTIMFHECGQFFIGIETENCIRFSSIYYSSIIRDVFEAKYQ